MWIVLLAALQVAAAPVPSEAHVFADWVVACDNGRRCQAIGVQPEGQSFTPAGVLTVEREAETEAPLVVRLTQFEGTPARLLVHGQELPVRLVDEGGDLRLESQDRAALLNQILYADQAEVQAADGSAIGQLSLDGLRHALLYMDEAQGRLHTPGALIRTGRRPAGAVPASVPIVRIAAATSERPLAISAARLARLRRDRSCEIGEVGGPDEAEIVALGGGRTLVLLVCGSGAYNVTYVPFVATRSGREIRIEPAPFDLELEEFEEQEGHRMLVNASWDAGTMTISDFSKGRGLGDCGSRSSYGWDGTSFRLLDREEMPECRGSIVYVTTWRVDVVR